MAAVFPSATNVFVRSHEATNKLVIDFARNIKKFAVNRYVQIVPVTKVAGYYLEMTVEEAGRIISSDLANFLWPDGQPRPEGNDNKESFNYKPYEVFRYTFSTTLGKMTIDQADWNIVAQYASIRARQAMTARTQSAINALTTTSNYDSSHVMDVTAIGGNGGTWEASTTARQDIQRSLETAFEKIKDDTLDSVQPEDMVLVVSSGLAAKMSRCQEIVDYIKGSPEALSQIRGDGQNAIYRLPNKLYGFEVVVESTRKVTSLKGAATVVKAPVLDSTKALLLARPGSLVADEAGPNFSTCCIFAYEEMDTETLDDRNNRRTLVSVSDTYATKLVAPASGVLFTVCSS